MARSVGSAKPPPSSVGPVGGRRTVSRFGAAVTRPRLTGGRPSYGRWVRRNHQPASSGRREAVAGLVGPAQPPPGSVGPAGGRRTGGWSGAAATRPVGRAGVGRVQTPPAPVGPAGGRGRVGQSPMHPPSGPVRPSRGRSKVGPPQPPPAPEGPAGSAPDRQDVVARFVSLEQLPASHSAPSRRQGGRRTVSRSGAAATRPVGQVGGRRMVRRSSVAATRARRAGLRPSHSRSVRCIRHPAPSGRREAVARSLCSAQPPPGPAGPAGGHRSVVTSGAAATQLRRAGGRPSNGQSVRRSRLPAPSDRWEAIARSIGPAQQPPGPVRPAEGRRKVGGSGATTTRRRRRAGGRRTGGRSGTAATQTRRAGGRPSHGLHVRRRRHPVPAGRRVAVESRSLGPAQPPPGPAGPADGRSTVGRFDAAAPRPRRAGGRPSHGLSVRRSRHQPPHRAGGRPSHGR